MRCIRHIPSTATVTVLTKSAAAPCTTVLTACGIHELLTRITSDKKLSNLSLGLLLFSHILRIDFRQIATAAVDCSDVARLPALVDDGPGVFLDSKPKLNLSEIAI